MVRQIMREDRSVILAWPCEQKPGHSRPAISRNIDHALTLEGIRAVLEPHYKIVGTVTDGRALLEAALRLQPDLIALDITMRCLMVSTPLLRSRTASRE